jgi:hypothetical protein
MNTNNSQDIAPYESVSQIDDVDITWLDTATGPSMLDISVSGVNTIASSNPTSVSMIGLPSEEHYLLMNKDEITVTVTGVPNTCVPDMSRSILCGLWTRIRLTRIFGLDQS